MVVCAPTTIHFFRQDTSHVVQYWNLGDGTISTLQTPVHLYTQAGTYNVVYVADTPYVVDTFNYPQTILVGGGVPNFTIEHSQSCTYTEVTVNPESPGIIDSLTWTFSDGFTSNDLTVTHQFQNSNSSYLVQLSYTDTLGCVANRMRSIFANPTIPDIDYATVVCNDTVHFSHDLPASYSLLWDFGDGTTSNDFEPSHFYTASGTYTP